MKTIYRHRLLAVALASLVAVVAASLVACVADDADADRAGDKYMTDTGQAVAYSGKWSVGTEQGIKGVVMVGSGKFMLDGAARAAVVWQLFPDSTVSQPPDNAGWEMLKFSATSASDNSLLYSIDPFTWSFTLLSDGLPRTAVVAFSPLVGTSDGISWGTLSKSGVLTVVLHATSYTIGDGNTATVDLRLVFTGKREK